MVWTEHRAEAQGSELDPSLSCRPPSSYHAVWAHEGSGKLQNPSPVTDQSVKVRGPSPARLLLGRKREQWLQAGLQGPLEAARARTIMGSSEVWVWDKQALLPLPTGAGSSPGLRSEVRPRALVLGQH